MWRCPHCGTPQAESARCWVCHRSSTTCSTCSHFRTALTGEAGWCALDPRRKALTGLEQRGCWQPRPATAEPIESHVSPGRQIPKRGIATFDGDDLAPSAPRIDFVPVELRPSAGGPPRVASDAPSIDDALAVLPTMATDAEDRWSDRTNLFGDLDA
jgi:hypothetical protein